MPIPEATFKRDSESDDQMIALALAMLAIDRPGWRWTIRGLCDDRGWRKLFESFYGIHRKKRHAG